MFNNLTTTAMRASTTFSVLFWIYAKRAKSNQTNIYVRITVNGKKSNISLKQIVDVNAWDAKNQKMKGSGAASRKLNLELARIKSDIHRCYQDLKQELRLPSAELVKARYLGEDKRIYTLRDIFEYHNQTMAHKLSKGTMGKFETTQKYVFVYVTEKYKTSDMYLKNLDYKFIIGFESLLGSYRSRPSQGEISNNVAMKHIQRLKKLVTLAYHLEWIDRNPFVKFKLKFEKKEREFLSKDELQRVLGFNSTIGRLIVVKDLFIFSCYTGLSYIDIIELSSDNIVIGIDGNQWIMTARTKTKIPVKIPLLPKANDLIKKYKSHARTQNSGKLMPKISNQKLNSYLKEIADSCGLKKNLTFHMARHTFATTVTLSNGVPIETVSKLLGHTRIATTQIYARVIERKVSEDMNKLRSVIKDRDLKIKSNEIN
ncbi:site-specific integrase [Snuella sedimenti]|nr:site-specific integrase [Snuella sedimenti]